MIGAEGAGQRVAAWLELRLPARLTLLEARLGLVDQSLARPSMLADHETGPVAIEQFPAVYVLPQRMTAMDVIEVGDGAEAYRVTYPVRVLAWLRSDDFGTTDLLRKRYALAIREALLERKQLTLPPEYASDDYGVDTSTATINPASIREDYAGMVDKVNGGTIAGVYVDVDVTFTETLEAATPLGQAATLELREDGDTAGLPLHPGL